MSHYISHNEVYYLCINIKYAHIAVCLNASGKTSPNLLDSVEPPFFLPFWSTSFARYINVSFL